jgi:hypothetical protein
MLGVHDFPVELSFELSRHLLQFVRDRHIIGFPVLLCEPPELVNVCPSMDAAVGLTLFGRQTRAIRKARVVA